MTSLTGEVNKFKSLYEEEGFMSAGRGGGGEGGRGCTLLLDPPLVFEENMVMTREPTSHDYRDAIVSEKLHF